MLMIQNVIHATRIVLNVQEKVVHNAQIVNKVICFIKILPLAITCVLMVIFKIILIFLNVNHVFLIATQGAVKDTHSY